MLLDLRHLVRTLRRSPASAVAAILTLSLTLGAGASIFAVVDAVLLTQPPFANPNALVTIGERSIADPAAASRNVTYSTFEAWRERAKSLAALEAGDGTNFTLTQLGPAERVSAGIVTPGYFALLGVAPSMGRTFTAADEGQRVAVVSEAFWRRKLAADPRTIGQPIVLGSQAYTVIGVLPQRVAPGLGDDSVWVPIGGPANRAGQRVGVIGRLAPGVTSSDLARALDEVSRKSSPPAQAVVTSLAKAIARDSPRLLRLLAGAAALAVLIAFTNLAGLLIVRSIDRGRELAVRTALGARRPEIARQLLLEAHALVAIGTVGGIVLAAVMTPAVGRLALSQFGALSHREIDISWRVIASVSMLALVCAWVCGLVPMLVSRRRSVVEVLRRGATAAPKELALRRVFVAGEIAVAFVLLVSMMLVGRSMLRAIDVNPGFDARGVLVLSVSVPAASYDTPDRVIGFYATLQRALDERLGPRTVGIINEIPLTGDRDRISVSATRADDAREVVVREAGTGYFDVMRIPLLEGRSFEANDDASVLPRVVLSKAVADRLFGSDRAVGRQITVARTQSAEVIGVVGDVKQRALDEAASPTVYQSAWQTSSRSRILLVRNPRADADVIAAVREEVARLDGSVPVYGGRTMQQVVAESPGMPARRVLTGTFMGFAALAVALGAIGLFGVIAHDVACRRSELALRIALGADPMRILRATVGHGAVLVGFGLSAGALVSMWAARALGGVIFGIGRFDVVSVAIAVAVLVAAAAAAVLPVARRAARTDPLIALRSE
ncbi:MAG TPA: ABC transporter permease [Vicinamibacterales bacterium]|jgi:predicted permease